MSHYSPQRMMIISPRRWLLSVSLVNVLISYCTYTTASHSVKKMDTDPTKHGPTYTVELNSLMHYKCLDTRYVKLTFLLIDRLGHVLDNRHVQDDNFKHISVDDHGYICHQKGKNN